MALIDISQLLLVLASVIALLSCVSSFIPIYCLKIVYVCFRISLIRVLYLSGWLKYSLWSLHFMTPVTSPPPPPHWSSQNILLVWAESTSLDIYPRTYHALEPISVFSNGTALVLWHCATSWKVAGLIPSGVIGIFQWQSFRMHCGPGVESTSNRNEYQEYFLGG